MTDAILSKRRVAPEKVDKLRDWFTEAEQRSETFERGLELENVFTEAAFLAEEGDGPVLYYYMEAGDDYPPEDIDLSEFPEELKDVVQKHRTVLEDVCVEDAREDDGSLKRFETLMFASTVERE